MVERSSQQMGRCVVEILSIKRSLIGLPEMQTYQRKRDKKLYKAFEWNRLVFFYYTFKLGITDCLEDKQQVLPKAIFKKQFKEVY